jgi:hypothetical protein
MQLFHHSVQHVLNPIKKLAFFPNISLVWAFYLKEMVAA